MAAAALQLVTWWSHAEGGSALMQSQHISHRISWSLCEGTNLHLLCLQRSHTFQRFVLLPSHVQKLLPVWHPQSQTGPP